jgi:hypothetical protein
LHAISFGRSSIGRAPSFDLGGCRFDACRPIHSHRLSCRWSIRAAARHYDRDRKQINRWIQHYQIALPHRG